MFPSSPTRLPQWVAIVLLLFLVWDLGFTFTQFYRSPLDGDVTNLVVPGPGYERIFSEPFGLAAIREGKGYGGSNRYFSHVAVATYYNHVPGWLQGFVEPLDSLYLANALIKLLIHLALIGLLSWYALRISGVRANRSNTLLTLAGFTALFQTYGNLRVMGIIDPATTFNFFYSLPMLGLLGLMIPYFNWLYRGSYPAYGKATSLGVVVAGIVLVLSGPLVAPSLLLLGAGIGLVRQRQWLQTGSFQPRALDLALIMVMLAALYSMWLGRFNVENTITPMPLVDRYGKLFTGLWRNLHKEPGLSVMIILQILLGVRIWRQRREAGKHVWRLIAFLLLFALGYFLLLPLGGYRPYRPYILRWDTQLPITLALMLTLVSSFLWLMGRKWPMNTVGEKEPPRQRKLMWAALALIVFYTAQDYHAPFANACERNGIQLLMEHKGEEVLRLPDDCSVLGWAPFEEPGQSVLPGILLHRWGITAQPVRYYMPEAASGD